MAAFSVRVRAILMAVVLTAGLSTGAWAEPRAEESFATAAIPDIGPEQLPTSQTPGVDGTYILGTGDEISVEDVTMGKLTTGQTKILADGTVDLPLIGEVSISGMSLDDAQAYLNKLFGAYYVNPAISIQVIYQHPLRVYVEGAVNNPGVYVSGKSVKATNNDKYQLGSANVHYTFYQFYLTDALIEAGGLSYNADLSDIEVHRTYPTPQIIHVNLWELLKAGSIVQDLPLREHDIITVHKLAKDAVANSADAKLLSKTNLGVNLFSVNVIGAVGQPGAYQVSSKDNILDVIAQAGGFSSIADQKKVFVLRTNAAGQVFKKQINATDPRLMGKGKPDWIALLPEDVVFVDDSTGKKAGNLALKLFDKATGAAMLPFFNQLIRNDK